MVKIGLININKKNLIPTKEFFINAFWFWVSAMIIIYWLRKPILDLFPIVETWSFPYRLIIYVLIGYYLKNIFDIKIGKREII